MNKAHLTDIQLYGLVRTLFISASANQADIKVNGASMSPFIKDESIVSIIPVNQRQGLGLGDIVAVICPDSKRVMIHRIIQKKKKMVLLKGDNNIHSDGWFKNHDIIGIVNRVKGKGLITGNCRILNILIAAGSRTGLLNRLFFPVLKTAKTALNRTEG